MSSDLNIESEAPADAVRGRITVDVNWGHCDPAQIVYYPNYFDWFDQATQALLAGVGLGQRVLRDQFKLITPIVDASARFVAPASYGDSLEGVSYVEAWGTTSFTIHHQFFKGTEPVAEGREIRVCVIWEDGDGQKHRERRGPGGLRAVPVPEELKTRLGVQN